MSLLLLFHEAFSSTDWLRGDIHQRLMLSFTFDKLLTCLTIFSPVLHASVHTSVPSITSCSKSVLNDLTRTETKKLVTFFLSQRLRVLCSERVDFDDKITGAIIRQYFYVIDIGLSLSPRHLPTLCHGGRRHDPNKHQPYQQQLA